MATPPTRWCAGSASTEAFRGAFRPKRERGPSRRREPCARRVARAARGAGPAPRACPPVPQRDRRPSVVLPRRPAPLAYLARRDYAREHAPCIRLATNGMQFGTGPVPVPGPVLACVPCAAAAGRGARARREARPDRIRLRAGPERWTRGDLRGADLPVRLGAHRRASGTRRRRMPRIPPRGRVREERRFKRRRRSAPRTRRTARCGARRAGGSCAPSKAC